LGDRASGNPIGRVRQPLARATNRSAAPEHSQGARQTEGNRHYSRMAWVSEQPVLTGAGVLLRAVTDADAEAIYLACQDPDIQHYTQVPVPYGYADADTFVARCRDHWRDGVTAKFAVCDRDTGRFLGIVGVIGTNHAERTAGLGYWTAAWGRGRGATGEAVRVVTAWAFGEGGLDTLVAEAETSNPASMKILASAGFVRQEGADEVIELKGSIRNFSIWRAHSVPER
jgi:RimJ/RimL family protein N-acetyltransferase